MLKIKNDLRSIFLHSLNYYYNGIFYTEGLLIAQILKEKYNVKLFCYSKENYKKCVSKKQISRVRLSKLSKVKCKELEEIKNLLLESKCPAYQEEIKERITKYVIDEFH